MSLVRLEATGLRNLSPTVLEPCPGLNFFIGPNACGKTSLLEAIYLLGRARSFRTAQLSQLIRFGEPALTVTGQVSVAERTPAVPIGIRIARGQRDIHVGGQVAHSSAELLETFPLLVIQPAGIALLEGAPKLRRQFMDFGVFHQRRGYLDGWRRYARALAHRNALLRAGRVRELAPWNHELARYGIMIAEARSNYLDQLKPYFQDIGGRFFAAPRFDLQVQAGWDVRSPLEEVLDRELAADLRYGHTHSGSHKGDFSILLDNRPVKAYVSRGQMKVLVYALLLAQSRLMEERLGAAVCVLIDDLASELDAASQRTLMELLHGRLTQFFITATARESIEAGVSSNATISHLAQGRIIQA